MARTNGTAAIAACGAVIAFASIAGCAALESWNDFSGGPVPQDSGSSDGASDSGAADRSVVDGPAPKSIAFVQSASTSQDDVFRATVNVTYAEPQIAGDLNVVIVGWYDTVDTVTSVVDTAGNAYRLAAGPTTQVSDTVQQSIYYASGITASVAGANVVTVTWDTQTDSPDVRVLEYSGLDAKDPLDTTAASSGVSTTASSGTLTTHFAPELLVVGGTSESGFTVAGAGYTLRIISAETNLAADQTVTAIGTYSTDAPTTPSRGWVMQLVAFH